MLDKTNLYDLSDIQEAIVSKTIIDVYEALEQKGYNPIGQIVGYLVSGDPGYITSYKDARNKITEYDRSKILEIILRDYIKKNLWNI